MRIFSGVTDFFNGLQSDPLGTVITLVYLTVCILFSLIIHECAHGYVALKCGDPTAKMLGRLSLDPRKHLDPMGTICMVFLRFGWAKPVPVNPRNFRNYRRDYILVSVAGIAVNLCIFVLSMLIAALLSKAIWNPELIHYLSDVNQKGVLINIHRDTTIRLVDLIAYYSPEKIVEIFKHFDGYSGFVFSASAIYNGNFTIFSAVSDGTVLMYIQRFFLMLAQMNLGLAVFNLLPVPPLDGFRLLDQFAFKGQLRMTQQTMQYIYLGFMIVLLSGMLTGLLGTINSTVFGWVSDLFAQII